MVKVHLNAKELDQVLAGTRVVMAVSKEKYGRGQEKKCKKKKEGTGKIGVKAK
jgi:hypothetical protein